MKKWSISGPVIVTPESVLQNSKIVINDEYIDEVSKNASSPLDIHIENAVILPGFINGHDHLLGTYYPKVGFGPYPNWLPWDNDLKSAPVYQERQQITNRDLYLLGAYRNLISGVTSVQDHIPHFVQDPFLDILPIKVISDFAMAHSIASFALNWGDGVEIEYKKAIENDIPFVTHISEGFDPETIRDIETLNRKGALGDHSVLIHGIAFSKDDIALIKERKASVVWCGDSNVFMFDKTTDIKSLLDAGVNVCIGTDSPMSGGENILYEVKFDRDFYNKQYNARIADKQLVKMMTENPAKAFRLYENGKISSGMLADMVVVKSSRKDPYESVINASLEDIILVVINGLPVYGYAELAEKFKAFNVEYQKIKIAGIDRFIIGDLLGVLKRINRAVGFKKKFPFMPVEL